MGCSSPGAHPRYSWHRLFGRQAVQAHGATLGSNARFPASSSPRCQESPSVPAAALAGTAQLCTKPGTAVKGTAPRSSQPAVSYSLCPYMGTSRGPTGNTMLLADGKVKQHLSCQPTRTECFFSEKQAESGSCQLLTVCAHLPQGSYAGNFNLIKYR